MVTTLGNLSGFAAPYMVGLIIEGSGSYRIALAALGIQSVVGAVIVAFWKRLSGDPGTPITSSRAGMLEDGAR